MSSRKRLVSLGAVAIAGTLLAAGCGSSSSNSSSTTVASSGTTASGTSGTTAAPSGGGGSTTVKVAYEVTPPSAGYGPSLMNAVKEFEAAYPKDKVVLQPINATESLYYTKLALEEKSASTAPDVLVEDSFQIPQDAAAHYIIPINQYLAKWADWNKDFPTAGHAEASGPNPNDYYGVPISTDTRGLWYNKSVLQKAGIKLPWDPKNWADIISAAQAIKKAEPNVVPFNINATVPLGEGTSLQGAQMLMSGTPDTINGTLYNPKTGKFIGESKGLLDSLTFYSTMVKDGLTEPQAVASNPNNSTIIYGSQFPKNELGISLDGNWVYSNWLSKAKGGSFPWPQWSTDMGWTGMPTENGQAPGVTSESGGWVYSIGSHAPDPQAAFNFITFAANKANSLEYDIAAGNIPARSDVATDPAYIASNASAKFFGSLVKYTHYRPKNPNYTNVSTDLTKAVDSVFSGGTAPATAMSSYAATIKGFLPAKEYDPGSPTS
jgi:multiple sugar transport system substrate-binding protein